MIEPASPTVSEYDAIAGTVLKTKSIVVGSYVEEQISYKERLFATEMKNLRHFGYGIKGFTLSMIETALEVSEGRIGGHEIQALVERGKAMLAQPQAR